MGFTAENEWGENEFVYPKIKWNGLNLRDRQNERQMYLNLYDKGLISRKRVLEEFDIDPDAEAEQIRYERIEQAEEMPPGMGGEDGEMGDGFGGGGGMDIGGGGGLGDLGGGGDGLDMGGGMDMGGGDAGGMDMGAAASTELNGVDPSQYGNKILKDKTRKKIDNTRTQDISAPAGPTGGKDASGFQRDEKGRIFMTSIEQKIMRAIDERQKSGQIKWNCKPSFDIKVRGKLYSIDLAFPQLKVAIEADGNTFHSSDEQVERDGERDRNLNSIGWTVLRFTDEDIEDNMSRVMDKIIEMVDKKAIYFKNLAKKSKGNDK